MISQGEPVDAEKTVQARLSRRNPCWAGRRNRGLVEGLQQRRQARKHATY